MSVGEHLPSSHELPGECQFPRVLLVLMTKVKADDPGNLLIRSQFGDWPQERLAQVHAAGDPRGHGEFCGHYYRLQACDRFLGGLFSWLRGGVVQMVAMDAVKEAAVNGSVGHMGRWAAVAKKFWGDWLVSLGIWEMVFHVRFSKPLARFLEDFKPDVVYCQGYSLGFATLPLLIARRFHIPICFQTTDDWPSYTYRNFPMSWLLRHRARQLINEATVRMAFGEKMRQTYEKRYQRPFLITYHADSVERFARLSHVGHPPVRTIAFTGSLALRRYEAINDLLQAVQSLAVGGVRAEVHVYCTGIPKEVHENLRAAPGVRFLPLPSHDALPSVLAQADVLFLPESFSVDPKVIALSLSSKCHLYMMSGRPVLVYGPPCSGTVDYARREGWAGVVAERSVVHLGTMLRKLLGDHQYSSQLTRQARAVARRNHELLRCRSTFRQVLITACARRSSTQLGGLSSPKRCLVAVSNGITPYGTHFLQRVGNELSDIKLRTIYTYEFSMGHWQISLSPSINATVLGTGKEATGQHCIAALPADWARGRRLLKEIQSSSPAAVMVLGYSSMAHLMAIEWCHRNSIPCLMFADSNILGDKNSGIKAWIKKLVVSWVVSRCSAVLVGGSLGAQYFQKYGARPEQVFFVPNEPDYSLIENAPPSIVESLAAEFRLAPGRRRLIYSGRLVAFKRVELLINAFAKVADLRPGWDLLIAGSGDLEADLRSLVPVRLRHRVQWTGFVASPQRMSALYRFADVLVLPSDYEPWALVVNEAADAGLALVCSDIVGAAAELLRDRVNGRTFLAGDITSLVVALLDVTDEVNLSRYRHASPEILKSWRRNADPVEGLRRALAFCFEHAGVPGK